MHNTNDDEIERIPYSRNNPPQNIEEAEEALDAIEATIAQIEVDLQYKEPDEDFTIDQFEAWKNRAQNALTHYKRKERYLNSFIREMRANLIFLEELNKIDDYTELLLKQINYEKEDLEKCSSYDLYIRLNELSLKKKEVENERSNLKERAKALGISKLVMANTKKRLNNLYDHIHQESNSISQLIREQENLKRYVYASISKELIQCGFRKGEVIRFLLDLFVRYNTTSKLKEEERAVLTKLREYYNI